MATAAFSVRMDEDLKRDFERMCESFGISMTAAINLFATAVVNERRIPFEIRSKPVGREEALRAFETARAQALAANPDGMTLEEINKEISEARTQGYRYAIRRDRYQCTGIILRVEGGDSPRNRGEGDARRQDRPGLQYLSAEGI